MFLRGIGNDSGNERLVSIAGGAIKDREVLEGSASVVGSPVVGVRVAASLAEPPTARGRAAALL